MLGPADRILVATDFSPDGDKALACAGELARRFGAETVVLHVHPGEAARAVGLADLLPGRLAACLSAMRDRGLPVRGLVRRGDPAIEILDPNHEVTASGHRTDVGEDRGPQIADVQHTGG